MAIFGNKKKSVIERLDELLAEIDRLPEDEQEKVWAHFDDAKEEMEDDSAEDKGKPDTEEELAGSGRRDKAFRPAPPRIKNGSRGKKAP